MFLLITAAFEMEEGRQELYAFLLMRFLWNLLLHPSISGVIRVNLRMLRFWPHLYHVKSKAANLRCAGSQFAGPQVDTLGVKALLQTNATLLDNKSMRADACPRREGAESVESGRAGWTSAPVGTHQAWEDETPPDTSQGELRQRPASTALLLCHTACQWTIGHSSKARRYYTYIQEILNRDTLQLLINNSSPPNAIRTI